MPRLLPQPRLLPCDGSRWESARRSGPSPRGCPEPDQGDVCSSKPLRLRGSSCVVASPGPLRTVGTPGCLVRCTHQYQFPPREVSKGLMHKVTAA